MKQFKSTLYIFSALLTALSISCSSGSDQTVALARINSIEVLVMESFPVQVSVIARGEFPDSCTSLGPVTQRREGNTFFVEIWTVRDAEQVCAQVITPFMTSVSLDVLNLPAGTYVVEVNGLSETFTLDVDNTPG